LLHRIDNDTRSDLIVVGAGIAGLACALVAVEQGLRVQVVDRDPMCTGASIRNFGFVCVTGQGAGATWRRARRSRDIWARIAPLAGIAIEHRGLYVQAQRPEAEAVLRELLLTTEGAGLEWLPPDVLRQRAPHLAPATVRGALYSPHELRIESRFAIEKLRHWLASRGVRFYMGHAAQQVVSGEVHLEGARLQADRIVVCPGTDIRSLFSGTFASRQTQLCQLQMLRVRPPENFTLGATVMSDLSLVRYAGFRELPGAKRMEDRLRVEVPHLLQQGIHLIVVQSADGSLIVGDSHQYAEGVLPFAAQEIEERILAEMQRMLRLGHYKVEQRWTGVYPSGPHDAFIETVLPGVQLLGITSGSGMSTAFALAEECLGGERMMV